MKTFFRNHSYTLLLIVVSFAFLFVLAEKFQQATQDQYLTDTVENGESLLTIAEKYYYFHGMSFEDSADWVERENDIANGSVQAGDILIVPVKKKDFLKNQHATVAEPGTELISFTNAESERN